MRVRVEERRSRPNLHGTRIATESSALLVLPQMMGLGCAWHEASVGTFAFYDAKGERLDTIYLARMPEAYKTTLVNELEAELHSVFARARS